MVAATEAAAEPAVALALWWGEGADRSRTEAAAATAATEAVEEAAAAQQQQRCDGGGGGGRRGGRGDDGNSSGRGDRGGGSNKGSSGDNKGSSDNKGSGDNRGSGGNSMQWHGDVYIEFLCFFSQIHFPRSILGEPHTDRFPDVVPKKLQRNKNHVSCERKKQESGGFLQELST